MVSTRQTNVNVENRQSVKTIRFQYAHVLMFSVGSVVERNTLRFLDALLVKYAQNLVSANQTVGQALVLEPNLCNIETHFFSVNSIHSLSF